jgi:hypothetical protein
MVNVVLPAYCPDVVPENQGGSRRSASSNSPRVSRVETIPMSGPVHRWLLERALRRRSLFTLVVGRSRRTSPAGFGSAQRSTHFHIELFSTFSGADIPVVEVLESLSKDRPADSGKRSVGTLIGRSGERNSTGPPNRSDCAATGRTATLRRSQQVRPLCTVDCMLNDRSF